MSRNAGHKIPRQTEVGRVEKGNGQLFSRTAKQYSQRLVSLNSANSFMKSTIRIKNTQACPLRMGKERTPSPVSLQTTHLEAGQGFLRKWRGQPLTPMDSFISHSHREVAVVFGKIPF